MPTKQKKIIARIIGGVGNQLFSYAAAKAVALANNAELVIDHKTGFENEKTRYQRFYQLDHFNISARKVSASEQLKPFSKLRRFIKKRYNRLLPFEKRNYIEQEKIEFDPRLLNIHFSDVLYIEGYWQSENYFNEYSDIIRRELEIIPPTDEVNKQVAQEIKNKNSVAVHIRFFDATGQKESENNVPYNYYVNALKKAEQLIPDAYYFVFSDRTEDVKKVLNLPENRYKVINHNRGDENAFADLWLMSQCKHFIIANSTFSWWGAWLAKNSGKFVIAPNFVKSSGTGAWGFEGLLPERWIKI